MYGVLCVFYISFITYDVVYFATVTKEQTKWPLLAQWPLDGMQLFWEVLHTRCSEFLISRDEDVPYVF